MKPRYARLSAKQMFCGMLGGFIGIAVGFGLPFLAGRGLYQAGLLSQDGSGWATEAIAWLVLAGVAVGAVVGARWGLSWSGYNA